MSPIDFVITILAGIGTGIFVGVFPGIGTGVFVAMIFPLLFELDLTTLFLFYFSLMASTQYYGSIVAIVFGIPGEMSSVPAVKHGHQLFHSSRYQQALCHTATASLMASLLALALFWILGTYLLDMFVYLLRGWVIVAMLTVTMILMIVTAQHKILALGLTLLGLALGKIGLSVVLDMRIMTFSWAQLDSGLPMFPLLCGLIVIPILWQFERERSQLPQISHGVISLADRMSSALRFNHWWAAVRGSTVGFFVGLIPGASYLVSSAVADNVEQRVSKAHPDRVMRQLIAAESANNAGAISALIPLTILGVPILLSEAIILGVAESSGFNYNTSMRFFQNNVLILMLGLAASSTVNWFMAGVFYNTILKIYQRVYAVAYRVVAVLCVTAMLAFAIDVMLLELSVLTFLAALMLGVITKDTQAKFCLIVAYVISPMYIDEIYRILLIQGIIS